MTTMIFLKKVLTSNWFLAIFPALLLIFFLPSFSSKYTLKISPAKKKYCPFFYSDLNSDSISEIVRFGKGGSSFFITVLDNDFRVYDQWNLNENMDTKISEIFFGNIDHDKYAEIFVFTHKNDSLFLNINEFFDSKGIKQKSIFITKIGFKNQIVISDVKPAGLFDANSDRIDEIYFAIITAFGQPRSMYSFDLAQNKLSVSQFTGNTYLLPRMADADGDKKPELIGNMNSFGNYRTDVAFTDSSTWLMVFNEKLEFEFPPVEFPGFGSTLNVYAFQNNGLKAFVLNYWSNGADTTTLKSEIMLYSIEGKLIRNRLYKDFGFINCPMLFIIKDNPSDRIYLIENKLIELNDKLEIVNSVDLPYHSDRLAHLTDINRDGKDELLIYYDEEGKLLLYSTDLDKLAEIDFKTKTTQWQFSQYLPKNKNRQLFLRAEDEAFYLQLDTNNLYYLAYLSYPGIYFLFLFFIILIRRINSRQIEQREKIKNRLLTLQLQGIKSQLDPHFTFNVLNGVSSMIYQENRDAAYDYMNKFTRLLRGMLNDAERIYRSLEEELTFVKTNLELEKLRFGKKFNYFIEMEEGLDMKVQVPKMVLQTFAENAVKHGITPCENGGTLKITAEKDQDYLKLTIEDNGIGRAQAAGKSTSTGKGLKLTVEFYHLLNQLNKKPIRHQITDLYSESGEPAGTRVEVWVPFDID
jgi:two-component sensor histidine kinase